MADGAILCRQIACRGLVMANKRGISHAHKRNGGREPTQMALNPS